LKATDGDFPSRVFSPLPFQSKLEVVEETTTSPKTKAVVSTSEYSQGWLSLNDGTILTGFSFGAEAFANGEVGFNTGMVGYPEALTDPSYAGQILVLTFPLVGNYGVPPWDVDSILGLPKYFESNKIHIRALIVSGYTEDYSHWNATMSLGQWLKSNGIPGLFGIDTRFLTKKLREKGTMLGRVDFTPIQPGQALEFANPADVNLVAEVSIKESKVYNGNGHPHILAYDCGMKNNIIRCLVEHGVKLTVVPYDFELTEKIYDSIHGIFISNGPGNPEMAQATIEQLKSAMRFGDEKRKLREEERRAYEENKGEDKNYGAKNVDFRTRPIFGICLGNQCTLERVSFYIFD
jgi:carbamoyl-phosphate synthase small subunit